MAANMQVFAAGRIAVITGSSSGIGLGMARRCANSHMHVFLLDRDELALAEAKKEVLACGASSCSAILTDVSQRRQIEEARDYVLSVHSTVHFLFSNAGTGDGGNALASLDAWESTIGTNMWGVIHTCQAFLPAMLAAKEPGVIVNTGSKQGITLPPGTALSYNVSKAGVKAFTEGLQHELRNMEGCQLTAHLMVPAFVYSMIGPKSRRDALGRAEHSKVLANGGSPEEAAAAFKEIVQKFDLENIPFGEHVPDKKPADAWTGDETADFVIRKLASGSFYLVQPEADEDSDGTKTHLRMTWSMSDLLEDRPPLSRWENGHKGEFDNFMKHGLKAKARL